VQEGERFEQGKRRKGGTRSKPFEEFVNATSRFLRKREDLEGESEGSLRRRIKKGELRSDEFREQNG
jgi:hypothetical protein